MVNDPYVQAFGPMVVGCLLAVLWWLISGRGRRSPRGRVAVTALIAGAVTLGGAIGLRVVTAAPLVPSYLSWPAAAQWYRDSMYWVPIVLGLIAVVVLMYPVSAPRAAGTADLTRRTPFTFGERWWFAAPMVVVAAVVVVTVTAGALSEPDEQGRYTAYVIRPNADSSFGTTIYGWHYSVPCLILIGALAVATVTALALNARPPIGADRDADLLARRQRAGSILAVTTGSLLLHLGVVLSSLAATAQGTATFYYGDRHYARVDTTLAGFEPIMTHSARLVLVLGFFALATVLLSAIPARRTATAEARS